VGTFFSGSKLSPNQILLLGRLWIDHVNVTAATSLTGHSKVTVVRFWKHFRQLVASSLDVEDTIIGGENIVVQVDETKLGKRKYNRGHRVEGVWVVVGVEITEARKVFIVPVERRDAETLKAVIKDHVRTGSKIHTDLWKGYGWIDDDSNYSHGTVNHSIEFKDSISGVNTNTVEGTNSGIKRRIPVRSRVRESIEGNLDEFVWRRKHERENLFECLITAMRDIHYDLE
jgi:transposase-like protein